MCVQIQAGNIYCAVHFGVGVTRCLFVGYFAKNAIRAKSQYKTQKLYVYNISFGHNSAQNCFSMYGVGSRPI